MVGIPQCVLSKGTFGSVVRSSPLFTQEENLRQSFLFIHRTPGVGAGGRVGLVKQREWYWDFVVIKGGAGEIFLEKHIMYCGNQAYCLCSLSTYRIKHTKETNAP